MKSLLLALLALAIGACASTKPPEPGGPGKLGLTAKKPFDCERKSVPTIPPGPPDPDPEKGYPDCKKGIPIAVIEFGGNCYTLIPYGELNVHARKGSTSVTWNLNAPEGYKFAKVVIKPQGVEQQSITTPVPRDRVWEAPTVSPDGRQYTWQLKIDAPASSFDHEVHVVKDGKICDQIDPVIHND